ncbi:MAG: hypothetical protein R3Y19_02510 [Rikenellaceae bacterium]
MNQKEKELSDDSMLGYLWRWFSGRNVPRSVRADLEIYRRAVEMLDGGVLPADMFVMVVQGIIGRIKRDPMCAQLMRKYLEQLQR